MALCDTLVMRDKIFSRRLRSCLKDPARNVSEPIVIAPYTVFTIMTT